MKKGFTLVELVAVITILSIILAMITIDANHYSNERKNKDYVNIVNLIQENTKILVNTNSSIEKQVNEKLSSEGIDSCKINYNLLIENNLMDEDTVNPNTNKIIDNNSYIQVSLNTTTYEYEYNFIYVDEENDENPSIENCLTD